MAKLPPTIKLPFDDKAIKDPELRKYLKNLIKTLKKTYEDISITVNLNRDGRNDP